MRSHDPLDTITSNGSSTDTRAIACDDGKFEPGLGDPRLAIDERFPKWTRPFWTWVTGKPLRVEIRSGQNSPWHWIATAIVRVILGLILIALGSEILMLR